MAQSNSQFNQEEFDKLFIRSDGFNHLLLSDVERLTGQIQKDFPDVIQV